MNRDRVIKEYFDWLTDIACGQRFSDQLSYGKLLARLHEIEFTYTIPMDENRAEDGKDLRYRFAITEGYENYADLILDILEGPCSVLEMLVALALRCEENLMDDPRYGDRTTQWFWGMIVSLGLGPMMDYNFDRQHVDDVIGTFLERKYKPDGRGGLFTIKNTKDDLRDVEIWYQLCWYINSIM
jgi:hypothetical protein